jgi:hypothetical protein
MASIEIYLTSRRDGLLAQEAMPLDIRLLSAAPLRAGRDWLLLQGRTDAAELSARAAWEGLDASARLHLELRDARGHPQWLGSLPPAEMERLARRAATALAGAGAWPALRSEDDRELLYKVVLESSDPTLDTPAAVDQPVPGAARLGIEFAGKSQPSPPPAIDEEDLNDDQRLVAEAHADVVFWLAGGISAQIRTLSNESDEAGEERALLLYGQRFRLRPSRGRPALPLFLVSNAVRPRLTLATATRMVFAKDALTRDGRAPIALLHTHLRGYGLEPSEQDLLDLDDLDHGGPGVVSIIVEARAGDSAAFPDFRVHARLGARGGVVCRAKARLLSGPIPCRTLPESMA